MSPRRAVEGSVCGFRDPNLYDESVDVSRQEQTWKLIGMDGQG